MAGASISVDQDQLSCSICLNVLKNPVTIPCGHNYCMVCINDHWDHENLTGNYNCPQCREYFTPRPALRRNNILADVVEQLYKTTAPAPAAQFEDVDCDFCTLIKSKAVKSCLTCLASYCESHLTDHLVVPALKKHNLIDVTTKLQEKICSQHNKPIEIYCRTDQTCICSLCLLDEHRGHSIVSAAAERSDKQSELEVEHRKIQQRMQQTEKKVQELKQAVINIKSRAQATMKDSEMIFTWMISTMEKRRLEMTKLIRDQEKAELSHAEELLQKLDQEIADLKRRTTELQKLSHTHDHIHVLQRFQSLRISSVTESYSTSTVHQHFSFDGVRKSLSDLKKQFEQLFKEDLSQIPPNAVAEKKTALLPKDFLKPVAEKKTALLPKAFLKPVAEKKNDPLQDEDFPKSVAEKIAFLQKEFLKSVADQDIDPLQRGEFMKYYSYLTLDPNTVHQTLCLTEMNRVVISTGEEMQYPDHPDRFSSCTQVLCKEKVHGRCYWEVERSTDVCTFISVAYKGIKRKGSGKECAFGFNNRSWSLECSSVALIYWHNGAKTELPLPSPTRVGVYVNHTEGTLCFYNISDSGKLIYKVQTKFTQPLYAGFGVYWGLGSVLGHLGSNVKLCDP